MSLKRVIRNTIIGDDKFIESYSEFRQVLLAGEFAIVGVISATVQKQGQAHEQGRAAQYR